MLAMEFLQTEWPMILVVLAVMLIITGLIRKLLKLAFIGVGLAVLGFALLNFVGTST